MMGCCGVLLVGGAGPALGLLEFDFSWVLSFLTEAKASLAVWFNWVVGFLFTYGKEIIGLLGGTYGILKWWYYREAVLHERLARYLDQQDQRLKNARRDLLYTIERPGERRRSKEPTFAVSSLRKILKRRSLVDRWSLRTPESAADKELDKAVKQIGKRMETLEKTQRSHREQTATAHILKGVIAALRAQRSRHNNAHFHTMALQEFRMALAVPGPDHRLFALEHCAHQLRCLGSLNDAGAAYDELDTMIQSLLAGKECDLRRASALRWRAVIYQADRWYNPNPNRGSLYAHEHAARAHASRAAHAPFREWEAIDQGDLDYLRAFIAHNLGFVQLEATRLTDAATSYSSAMPAKSSVWRMTQKERRLALAARAGSERVTAARAGAYEREWLLPPTAQISDQPQSQATPVSSTGSDQGVPQAT